MHRGRRDSNHKELVTAFKAMGCSVVELTATGIPGWPDLVCGHAKVNRLVELKNLDTAYGRKGLNSNQTAFARDWRGEPVYVVSTVDEVAGLVNSWRKSK